MRQLNKPFACSAVLLLALLSCNSGSDSGSVQSQPLPYFSLAEYFEKEAARLQKHNPEVIKTVEKDGAEERKTTRVADWEKELALFVDADINKPAWKNSYRINRNGLTLTYTSTDSALRTKEIRVERSAAGDVTHIHVKNQVSNMLYKTDEQLDYYVDSLYRITKQQYVWIIGKSHYNVAGEWH